MVKFFSSKYIVKEKNVANRCVGMVMQKPDDLCFESPDALFGHDAKVVCLIGAAFTSRSGIS